MKTDGEETEFMKPLLLALIILLVVHYFLAIFTVYLLLKDKGLVKGILPWNLVILLITVIGPLTYLVYRCVKKKN